jgi:predicted cupin superfamily sugar epimerase
LLVGFDVASAEKIIRGLGLQRLEPEGGYYVRTYHSSEKIPRAALPGRYNSDKTFGTAIYYLLTSDTCSALHRLRTDEIFHFYLGDPVVMLQLHTDGTARVITIGNDIENGHLPQVLVPKKIWQGSCLREGGEFALMGTTMAPGFDTSDYEAGDRERLIEEYPDQEEMIIKLTPKSRRL